MLLKLLLLSLLALSAAHEELWDELEGSGGDPISTSIPSTSIAPVTTIATTLAATTQSPIASSSIKAGTTGTATPAATTQSPNVTISTTAGTTGKATTATTRKDDKATTQAATTLPTTSVGSTLPPVNSQQIPFNVVSCSNGFCTYELQVPGNNQQLLTTEDTIIEADRSNFTSLQSNVTNFEASLSDANDNATQILADLQKQVDDIQKNLDLINAYITQAQAAQSDTLAKLIPAESYIQTISNNPTSCYAVICFAPTTPTTPPPPTTTPLPTTQSPCASYSCPSEVSCLLDGEGKPYCESCEGNLDPYQSCSTGGCSSGQIVNSSNTPALFASPGFNITASNGTTSSGLSCTWKIESKNGLALSDIALNFDSTVKLTLTKGSTTTTITKTQERVLRTFLKTAGNYTIKMTTSAAADGSFFDWKYSEYTATTTYADQFLNKFLGLFE